jgi:hypothetical protein
MFHKIFCKLGGCTDCDVFATCAFLEYAFSCAFVALVVAIADAVIYNLWNVYYLKLGYVGFGFLLFLFLPL